MGVAKDAGQEPIGTHGKDGGMPAECPNHEDIDQNKGKGISQGRGEAKGCKPSERSFKNQAG